MSIPFGSNISYRGPLQNFVRDSFDTLADMKDFNEAFLPEIFIATCLETGKLYIFNASNDIDTDTGKWREVGSGGSPALTKEIVAATDIGLIKEGDSYPVGTLIEDIVSEMLSGKKIVEDSFYYGVSDTRSIASLADLTGSTSPICTVAPNNQYTVFAIKEDLGELNIQDEAGFPYNSDFDKSVVTYSGTSYNLYVGKYRITSGGFTYKISF